VWRVPSAVVLDPASTTGSGPRARWSTPLSDRPCAGAGFRRGVVLGDGGRDLARVVWCSRSRRPRFSPEAPGLEWWVVGGRRRCRDGVGAAPGLDRGAHEAARMRVDSHTVGRLVSVLEDLDRLVPVAPGSAGAGLPSAGPGPAISVEPFRRPVCSLGCTRTVPVLTALRLVNLRVGAAFVQAVCDA
jgi:hypothetical protein